ncbi:MAG: phosphopantetheine-binding protein [Actinomycetota bacterium]
MTIDTSDAVAGITECLVAVIGDEFLLDVEITAETSFSRDLELESIEFVAVAERLQQRYGGQVDFTSFLAGLSIDEILALTIGALAGHITVSLAPDAGNGGGGNGGGVGGGAAQDGPGSTGGVQDG